MPRDPPRNWGPNHDGGVRLSDKLVRARNKNVNRRDGRKLREMPLEIGAKSICNPLDFTARDRR
jgi:hypothetical protein